MIVKTYVSTTALASARHYALFSVIGAVCLLAAQVVTAGITKCTLADGTVVFQDTACAVIPKAEVSVAPAADRVPLGIEKTWFDPPSVIPYEAICTIAGCDCGEHSREFKNGLPMAIADALYLDGSWHRLDAILTTMESSTHDLFEYDELSRERDEAACNILMSQKTLRMFGKKAVVELKRKKRYAEDMGWDNPEDCDAGNTRICEHINNIALHDRVLSDIRALGDIARLTDDNLGTVAGPSHKTEYAELPEQVESNQLILPKNERQPDVPVISAAQQGAARANDTNNLPVDF